MVSKDEPLDTNTAPQCPRLKSIKLRINKEIESSLKDIEITF